MAKFNPPENLNFKQPSGWPAWKQRFSRYQSATMLGAEDGEVQVSTLIYAIGSEAENVFKSFTFWADEDQDDYNTVLAIYDAYFVPKRTLYTKERASISECRNKKRWQRHTSERSMS